MSSSENGILKKIQGTWFEQRRINSWFEPAETYNNRAVYTVQTAKQVSVKNLASSTFFNLNSQGSGILVPLTEAERTRQLTDPNQYISSLYVTMELFQTGSFGQQLLSLFQNIGDYFWSLSAQPNYIIRYIAPNERWMIVTSPSNSLVWALSRDVYPATSELKMMDEYIQKNLTVSYPIVAVTHDYSSNSKTPATK